MPNPAYQQVAKVLIDQGPFLSRPEREALKGILNGFGQPQLPFPSYTVSVNYNKTVKQLIKDGKYDWANGDVSDSHFPLNKKGEEQVEIFIVSIDHRMSDPEVTQFINSLGIQDVNVKEELSLGAQYPDLLREDPIVGRGSKWRDSDGDLLVPSLRSIKSRRGLFLVRLVGDWYSHWQFACKRK